MSVLDYLKQYLGGEDPEAGGLAAAAQATAPDALRALQGYLGDVASGRIAAGGVLGQNNYDPNRSFAENALNPKAIEQATEVAGGIGPGAIRAWHASPYDFNKFDLSKVGSGQGAQSYGHGIYAAENPAVSGKGGQYDLEFTAKNLGKYDLNPGELQIHRMLREDRSDMDILGELAKGGGYTFDEAVSALERVKSAKAKIYEVDIHADPKAFLDWDRSLAGQSPEVLTALQQKLGQPTGLPPGYRLRQTGSGDYMVADDLGMGVTGKGGVVARGRTPEEALRLYLPSGEEFYTRLSLGGRDPDSPAASSQLREAGIPGIRYLDQGSRAGGEGTSNYAVFDPSIIEILRKYGILPPVVAGGGLLATQQEPPT